MIASLKSKALKQFWLKNDASGLRPDWFNRIRLILSMLDVVSEPKGMDLPGLNFHALSGDQAGRFSVLVSRNWRITFGFDGGNIVDVVLEDYHGR